MAAEWARKLIYLTEVKSITIVQDSFEATCDVVNITSSQGDESSSLLH